MIFLGYTTFLIYKLLHFIQDNKIIKIRSGFLSFIIQFCLKLVILVSFLIPLLLYPLVIYHPTKLSSHFLIRHGCGQYFWVSQKVLLWEYRNFHKKKNFSLIESNQSWNSRGKYCKNGFWWSNQSME
jgi:hypothetical protein